jgi:biofilm PGA synthesis N-glycosyltransferase PgaC
VLARAWAFWTSAAGAGWVLGGYPCALALAAPRPWRKGTTLPSVTVLVPTFRERELIAAKLATVVALDYPPELLETVVVSDGDPALAQIAAAALPSARVRLLAERSGKPTALNTGLEEAGGELVLITDAHSPLAPASLRAAVRHLADPAIAAVTGRWGEDRSAYDRYEHMIRALESRSGSTTGVSGSFLLVRRELIPRFPDDIVNDDLWLAVELVRRGGRVVYEPAARTVEAGLAPGDEARRRTRIGAGRIGAVGSLRALPRGYAWRIASHKLGRLALPFLLLVAQAASLAMGRRRPYRQAALLQAGVYATGALAAAGVAPPGPAGRLARAAGQFLLGNVAVGAGTIRGLRGRQAVRWTAVR